MTFNTIDIYTGDIYCPENEGIDLFIKQEGLNKIVVSFDNSIDIITVKLKCLSAMVKNAIALMNDEQRALESERFFLYLISYPRKDIKDYLQPVLDYFHLIGYLKFKKNIYNDNKQQVIRYRVEFKNTDGKLLIIKRYSSLAQLSDDIGKKMTSLHYQLFKTNV
jgi:hypothetical protein|tara:strand:+ start:87 stop:578 length:492 start_codon:yes stop_codon:yes gene_type:complete